MMDSLSTNTASYLSIDSDAWRLPQADELAPANARFESRADRGEHTARDSTSWPYHRAPHSLVDVSPRDVVKRRTATWQGMAAEFVQITRHERTEHRFCAPTHLLVVHEQGVRRDGETVVQGLPRSILRDFARKLTFVPGGHGYYEWHEPRTLARLMYFYIDPASLQAHSEIDVAALAFAPRLFFEDSALWDTALKLKRSIESPTSDNRLYSEALGVVLVHELMRLGRGTPRVEPQVRGGLAAWQQRVVADYIEENLAEHISLATLAQLARLSPYHFCRVFKRSFGVSPHRYHTARRIERAKMLLAKPVFSVTEIGLTVGFSETSSFTAAFRKATGLTPTGYHRNLG